MTGFANDVETIAAVGGYDERSGRRSPVGPRTLSREKLFNRPGRTCDRHAFPDVR